MRKIVVIKLALGLLLLGAAGTMSACNTRGGIGEDVGALGLSVTTGADRTKRKM